MPREDLQIKILREDLSKKRKLLLSEVRELKRLKIGYERVIDDLRKTLKWYKDNAYKVFFFWLIEKIKVRFGRR
jgi:hypothetical protein